MIESKYGYGFDDDAVIKNINRLTNQLWKLIPMRENNENWLAHLNGLIIEISGLGNIFYQSSNFISLLSKLEGIKSLDTEFILYRKIVFESISLLREMMK